MANPKTNDGLARSLAERLARLLAAAPGGRLSLIGVDEVTFRPAFALGRARGWFSVRYARRRVCRDWAAVARVELRPRGRAVLMSIEPECGDAGRDFRPHALAPSRRTVEPGCVAGVLAALSGEWQRPAGIAAKCGVSLRSAVVALRFLRRGGRVEYAPLRSGSLWRLAGGGGSP